MILPNDEREIKDEKTVQFKVSKDVIKHLSVGLYSNFARAIKELISNSYDSNSLETKIRLNLEEKWISILDNGDGMDFNDVDNKLFNLADSGKNDQSQLTKTGRMTVGAFGIGFVSIFPYCEKIKLFTKKIESDDMLDIEIDTKKFFSEGKLELQNIPIKVKILQSDLEKNKGETMIRLENISPQYLKDLSKNEEGRSSLEKLSGYEKFRWTLCQYAPIQYPPERDDLRSFFDTMYGTPMRLWFDGDELFRNVPPNCAIVEKNTITIDGIDLKYVIMTPYKPIEPQEARGFQLRFRNVGIGLPNDFDVVKATGANLGKVNYFCGEIHIKSDISKYILIDRDNLSYTPNIQSLYETFRKKLYDYNWKVEDLAKGEKPIYAVLSKVDAKDKLINEMKSAGLVHFESGRIRTSRGKTKMKKNVTPTSPIEKAADAIRSQGFNVVMKGEPEKTEESPIKILKDKKTVLIYEKHKDFSEKLLIFGKPYEIDYDKWDFQGNLSSTCRLNGNHVTFNTNHPLFSLMNESEEVKRLIIAEQVLVSSIEREKSEQFTDLFYQVLKEAYMKE